MKKEYVANPIRKTSEKKRKNFKFEFVDGNEVVIKPEDFPNAEIWIHWEHLADDREVYHNIKNAKLSGEWNISLDEEFEFEDSTPLQIQDEALILPFNESKNPAVERMREIVETLPVIQQQIYQLYADGYNNMEIAEIIFKDKKKESSVRYHMAKIKAAIKNNF